MASKQEESECPASSALRDALLHLATLAGDLGEPADCGPAQPPLRHRLQPSRDDKLPHVKEAALSILVFTIVRGSNPLSKRFKTK
jgi:hypothetical protein